MSELPKEINDGDRHTCEVVIKWAKREEDIVFCGTPATQKYPAMGGGYMHLCDEHSIKHLDYTEPVR